jgi:hypothetical protein
VKEGTIENLYTGIYRTARGGYLRGIKMKIKGLKIKNTDWYILYNFVKGLRLKKPAFIFVLKYTDWYINIKAQGKVKSKK